MVETLTRTDDAGPAPASRPDTLADQAAGRRLGSWYTSERILDEDPYDVIIRG
ncbi:hypothetical protein [Streptomyces sp. NPDC002851]